jgi:hypothetical protein
MAHSTGLGALLAAAKAHAAAVAVVGTVVVAGGAATLAVTTGALHLSGHQAEATPAGHDGTDGSTARAQACTNHNGDAQRLASVYAPMFGGSATTAQNDICTLFVNSAAGHALGFGEVQKVLDIATTIEAKQGGSTACLTTPLPASGHGKPSDAGKPSFTVPSASEATTMGIVTSIVHDMQAGTPLEQLARNCDVPHRPGDAGSSSGGKSRDSGSSGSAGNAHSSASHSADVPRSR